MNDMIFIMIIKLFLRMPKILGISTERTMGFPGSSVDKESACRAADPDSIPGSGRSPREGNGSHSSILA